MPTRPKLWDPQSDCLLAPGLPLLGSIHCSPKGGLSFSPGLDLNGIEAEGWNAFVWENRQVQVALSPCRSGWNPTDAVEGQKSLNL